MPATLLPPPAPGTGDHGPTGPDRPAVPDDDRGRRRRRPGRRALAVLLTATALLGGAGGAGAVVLTGAAEEDDPTATTTVAQPSSSDASDSSTTGLDAGAVYESASPGVVEITASGTGSAQPDPFGQGSSESSATGSGFVVDSDGHIVTAAHVVDGDTSLQVKFSDGTTRSATLTGKDDATDVAVLKVNPSGLTLQPLELGNSAALDVGDAVAAIGSPFGYEDSLSTGVVSGLDRTIEAPNGLTVAHAVQIDAAINPGNSGGPILDSGGRVIGMADQIATDGSSEQSSGVGFAVPIDLIVDELDDLKAGQTVSHAYLGVGSGDAAGTTGALVASVTAGSPAADAGVEEGDIVTAIDGEEITGSGDLVAAIAAHDPGDRVELAVRRDSRTEALTVTLGTQPSGQSARSATP